MIKNILSLLFTSGCLVVLLGLTGPDGNNIVIYLGVFGLIYIICMQIIYLLLKVAYPRITKSNKLFISIVIAFTPVALLALSTLSSMKLIDVLLSLGVPLVIIWYGLRQGLDR